MQNGNEEKKLSGEVALQSPFLRKLDNFWYHYKWPVIGVAVALIIALVCILQTCSQRKEDTLIVYAGPVALLPEGTEQISQVISGVMPYDPDENGEMLTKVSAYEIYSEEQIRAFAEEYPGQSIDKNRNQNEYRTYTSYQGTGQTCIYFLDPWLYESLDEEYLCPLSELTDGSVRGALEDGYGVRLGDTALYEEYGVIRMLPEDTVICLMNPFFMTKSWDEEAYAFEQDLFVAIVTYGEES